MLTTGKLIYPLVPIGTMRDAREVMHVVEVSFTAMVRHGSKNRLDITIPKKIVQALRLKPGDLIVVEIRNIIRKEGAQDEQE